MAIVTLLTDFSGQDAYVGAMKGAILTLTPNATIVDITHEVPPQNILSGAYLLKTTYSYFPPGTIHVAVVDPGVGTERRAIAAQTDRHTFLAPDNGLLTWSLREERTVRYYELNRPETFLADVSHTFHGRDVFAAVAGHLASGEGLGHVGAEIFCASGKPPIAQLDIPVPENCGHYWLAHVIHVDRFGNLITDYEAQGTEISRVLLNDQMIPFAQTYGRVPHGSPVCVVGSSGHLELCINGGNAAQSFGSVTGASLRVYTG